MSDDLTFELFNEIANFPTAKYSAKERYHDYRQLFMGSEQGKRVLKDLVEWGGILNPSIKGAPIDPLNMAIREGERNYAVKLLFVVANEPPEKPTKQTR